jgi:hypothetical protein
MFHVTAAPTFPELEVGNPLDLFPEEPISCDFVPELTWEHEWPFNNRSGVYLIYSDKQDLLYIGQAHHLGKRLYDYFGEERFADFDTRLGRSVPDL